MNEVLARIHERRDSLIGEAPLSEKNGRLTANAIADIRASGIMKMLQSKRHGGYESHPAEFAEAAMTLASYNAAAGWVGGVVGVHPWQISGFTAKLQDEIWGSDPDTWVSSPYAPIGMLEPVDGGYRVSGRVPFSSGGEDCEWAITGALRKTPDGPPAMVHIVMPRSDYHFDQDSWDVIGLRGTASKDLVVDEAFIPAHRVYDPYDFDHGQAFAEVGITSTLYQIPFPVIFSYAINSASQGIAEGAMNAVLENAKQRVDARGTSTLEDPYQMTVIAECAAEVRAGRTILLADGHRMFDEVAENGQLSFETRAEIRANGVRSIRRSVDAIERAFNYAGGRGVKLDHPVNRGLRDATTTLAHICNAQHPIYQVWARVGLGLDHDLSMAFW